MGTALFDLDNTLLGGDSDYLWGQYLVDIGAVDATVHERENARFLAEYQEGVLDVREFLGFQLRPLADNATADLLAWRERFVREWIAPIVLPRGRDLVSRHRGEGHTLAIVTSTNAFITRPIADLIGIAHLLATEPAFEGGRYTGLFIGEPCSGPGKVTWVERWSREHSLTGDETWFYSDSAQDLPLLEWVDHPVAVDPDPRLRRRAEARDWPILSLR